MSPSHNQPQWPLVAPGSHAPVAQYPPTEDLYRRAAVMPNPNFLSDIHHASVAQHFSIQRQQRPGVPQPSLAQNIGNDAPEDAPEIDYPGIPTHRGNNLNGANVVHGEQSFDGGSVSFASGTHVPLDPTSPTEQPGASNEGSERTTGTNGQSAQFAPRNQTPHLNGFAQDGHNNNGANVTYPRGSQRFHNVQVSFGR